MRSLGCHSRIPQRDKSKLNMGSAAMTRSSPRIKDSHKTSCHPCAAHCSEGDDIVHAVSKSNQPQQGTTWLEEEGSEHCMVHGWTDCGRSESQKGKEKAAQVAWSVETVGHHFSLSMPALFLEETWRRRRHTPQILVSILQVLLSLKTAQVAHFPIFPIPSIPSQIITLPKKPTPTVV